MAFLWIWDRVVSPKPYDCGVKRPFAHQTTNPLMEVRCACFRPGHSPYSNYLYRTLDIAVVGTIFNVFSYNALTDRDSNLSPSRQPADALRVEPWVAGYYILYPFE